MLAKNACNMVKDVAQRAAVVLLVGVPELRFSGDGNKSRRSARQRVMCWRSYLSSEITSPYYNKVVESKDLIDTK